MIDTDKYEGHLMDGDFKVWGWSSKMLKVANYEEQMATAALLKDAPCLLEEVKRLREGIKRMAEICEGNSNPWNSNPYLSDALKELVE